MDFSHSFKKKTIENKNKKTTKTGEPQQQQKYSCEFYFGKSLK